MADHFNMQRFGAIDWKELRIETSGAQEGICDCCGTRTRRVWGVVLHPIGGIAAYFVVWPTGKRDHGAKVDLIVGAWGSGATQEERGAVSLNYCLGESGSGFAIVDAPNSLTKLAGRSLSRAEVVGTPLADQVFAIADAVFMTDPRLNEVRTWR